MENKPNNEFNDYKSPIYPFYFNRKDKRVLVPKLVGIGLTLNFGHWGSWVLIFALLVLPLAVTLGINHWLK